MNISRIALAAAAALIAGTIAALGNATLFTSIGDQVFYGPLGSTYVKNVPLTGFSLTFANAQGDLLLRPAGTLAAGYVTLAPLPPDGRRACIFSTQTITTLYLTKGAAAQTLNDAVTTLAANARVCYTYGLSNLTWDRS